MEDARQGAWVEKGDLEEALGRRKDNRGGLAAEEGEKAGEGGDTGEHADLGMPGLLVRCTEDAVWPGKEQRGRGPSHTLFSSPPD